MWFDGNGYEWLQYVTLLINLIIVIVIAVIIVKAIKKYYKKIIDKKESVDKDQIN